jgi:hypothetical protein
MGNIRVIMELSMLILIEVQASDNIVHSPLHVCVETILEKCEEIEEKPEQLERDHCIYFAFANCFKEAIPDDPVYKLVAECFEFCHLFTYLHSSCLKLSFKNCMKKHLRFHL